MLSSYTVLAPGHTGPGSTTGFHARPLTSECGTDLLSRMRWSFSMAIPAHTYRTIGRRVQHRSVALISPATTLASSPPPDTGHPAKSQRASSTRCSGNVAVSRAETQQLHRPRQSTYPVPDVDDDFRPAGWTDNPGFRPPVTVALDLWQEGYGGRRSSGPAS